MNLNALIPLMLDNLPPELIDGVAKTQLEQIAGSLPIASGGILELPLGRGGVGLAGLGVCLTQKEGGFSLLEKPEASFGALSKPKVWAAIKKFAQTRSKAGHPLRRAVTQSWLEFDMDPVTKKLPAPGFFFKPEEPYNRPIIAPGGKGLELIQQGLESLDVPTNPASLQALGRCIEIASASTCVGYIGVMLGRGTPGFRLVLAGMPTYNLMGFLKKIDFPHRKGLLPLADFFTSTADVERVSLHIDINNELQAQLGLEVAMDPKLNPVTAWQNFLQRLPPLGVSTAAKAAVLPAWIRWLRRAQVPEKWPEVLGSKYASLKLDINHVKFTYRPGEFSREVPPGEFGAVLASQGHAGEMSAKAYLAYQPVRSLPGDMWT